MISYAMELVFISSGEICTVRRGSRLDDSRVIPAAAAVVKEKYIPIGYMLKLNEAVVPIVNRYRL